MNISSGKSMASKISISRKEKAWQQNIKIMYGIAAYQHKQKGNQNENKQRHQITNKNEMRCAGSARRHKGISGEARSISKARSKQRRVREHNAHKTRIIAVASCVISQGE